RRRGSTADRPPINTTMLERWPPRKSLFRSNTRSVGQATVVLTVFRQHRRRQGRCNRGASGLQAPCKVGDLTLRGGDRTAKGVHPAKGMHVDQPDHLRSGTLKIAIEQQLILEALTVAAGHASHILHRDETLEVDSDGGVAHPAASPELPTGKARIGSAD